MGLFHSARILFSQFVHNLGATDWASRHVFDDGYDLGDAARLNYSEEPVSGLSVALQHMGLIRPVPSESPNIEV